MRILGVSQLWPKLAKPGWTTFRFPRRDRDWAVGEVVQVVYKPRSPKATTRGVLGIAEIVKIEQRWVVYPVGSFILDLLHGKHWDDVLFVSNDEAEIDGFSSREEFIIWISLKYGGARTYEEPMNRISLKWHQLFLYHPAQAPDTAKAWGKLLKRFDEFSHIVVVEGPLAPIIAEAYLLKECGIEPPQIVIEAGK